MKNFSNKINAPEVYFKLWVLSLNKIIIKPTIPSTIAVFFIFNFGKARWRIDSTLDKLVKVNAESATINTAIIVIIRFIERGIIAFKLFQIY